MNTNHVPSLGRLLKTLQQVPYLASKNLYRVATHFLDLEPEKLEQFCAVLREARNNITPCETCCYWRERSEKCMFCSDSKRKQDLICVVETWYDVATIESTRAYDGVYHVLGGVIYPLEGVGPEDLSIDALIARARVKPCELILALSQTPEGEATASFIASKLKDETIQITCLARGMPVGSSIGAMDRITVHKALSERRPF